MDDAPTVEHISNAEWDELAPRFRDLSYRQCSSYAEEAARHVGATSEFNRIMESQNLIGLANVRVKVIPMTRWGIAYASYAPIVMQQDRYSEREFGRCLDALCEEYVERRQLVLRVVPSPSGGIFQQTQVSYLEARGFCPCLQPPRKTFVLDLAGSLDELRGNLDPKWRYSLTKSEKSGLKISRSVELNDFDLFNAIFLDCTQRKGFMPSQDARFFKYVQLCSPADQKLVLHLAWHGDELVAGHLGSYVGDTAVFLLGAASLAGRDLCASYLLQWSAISYARTMGNSYYDLGGMDERQNPGVYRFKRRLNGRSVTEIGPYELAPDRVSRRIIHLAERARTAVRGK